MTVTCWAPGCRSGYDRKSGTRHFFCVPKNPDRLKEWARRIPRKGVLTPSHRVCDLHFESHFIVKSDDYVINGKRVSLVRERWCLTPDAVPTVFPNIPKYLSTKLPQRRKVSRLNCDENALQTNKTKTFLDSISVCSHNATVTADASVIDDVDIVPSTTTSEAVRRFRSTIKRKSRSNCMHCKVVTAKLYQRNRQVRARDKQLFVLKRKLQRLQTEYDTACKKLDAFEQLPAKPKQIVSQVIGNVDVKSSHGNRYSADWIIDSLLIKCKSPSAYKLLRTQNYLPLPSISTLNRSIRNLTPDFGFDSSICAALAEKLKAFPVAERRGMLMYDEMQVSKHVDFRPHLGKNVGFVDFGTHTTQQHLKQQGDHALVFLFRPHLNGWVQTIGCFCSAGTTPAVVLSKLILEAVILLENSGAQVDGLVCDGASTNRKAWKLLGFCGKMDAVSNKMPNPCDESRHIYFVCDAPHLLKTIRNNLLQSTMFVTEKGMVKLEHYRILLANDLNPVTGLRAVPKVTEKHVEPNNFQKMSVRVAAQLFSKSVADGLTLYKPHVAGLHDCDPTVAFTRKVNDVFDLLNGRHPIEAIRLNSKRDRLKELAEAEQWLDDWQACVQLQPAHHQKLFLSSQTSQGLRVTLRSVRELAQNLLSSGFPYVLTGKFNQDSLEMFFSMVRQSSGAEDHPSVNQFLYIYRLLSVSNLIRSPTRASVQSEPAKLLVTAQAYPSRPVSVLRQLQHRLQSALKSAGSRDCAVADAAVSDDGNCLTDLTFAVATASSEVIPDDGLDALLLGTDEDDELFLTCDNEMSSVPADDDSEQMELTCDSDDSTPFDCIFYYVAGYIAFKLRKFTSCVLCKESVIDRCQSECSEAQLVLLRTHGGLQFPSTGLRTLLSVLERYVQKHTMDSLSACLYQEITEDVLSTGDLAMYAIGCLDHASTLTAHAVQCYVVTRLHFLNRCHNRQLTNRQMQHKLKKISKLT